MNIFIVQSPFQLLNAIEAREHLHKTDSDILVVSFSKNINGNNQINEVLKLYDWPKVIKQPMYFFTSERLLRMIYLIFFLKSKKVISNLFIGDFKPDDLWLIANNLNLNKIYLLDDGGQTLNMPWMFKNIKNINKERDKRKDIIAHFFGLKGCDRKMIGLFTMYQLPKPPNMCDVVINNFKYTKSKNENAKENIDDIYFVGQSFISAGIIKPDEYYSYLNKIRLRYKNKNLFYLPHRKEDVFLLRQNCPNLEILKTKVPIELYFLLKKIKPLHIASFCSTALESLNLIYNIDNVDSFILDYKLLSVYHKKIIEDTYVYYKNKFNLIELK